MIRLVTALALVSSVAGFNPRPASGQEACSACADSLTLAEIVVEADRIGTPRERELLSASLMSAGLDLAALLERRLGLYLHSSGPGSASTARLRGWDASHTAVTLDGVRLIDPQSGQIDLAMIPASFLQGAILKSGPGNEQGALGGTIELRTLAVPEGIQVTFAAGGGAFGGRQAFGSVSRGGATGRGMIGVDAARSPTDWAIPGGRRTGTGRDRISILAKAAGWTRWGDLSGQLYSTRTNTRLPGPANARPRDASQTEELVVVSTRLVSTRRRSVTSGRLSAQFSTTQFEDRESGRGSDARTGRIAWNGSLRLPSLRVAVGLAQAWLADPSRRESSVEVDIEATQSRADIDAGLAFRADVRSGETSFVVPRLWIGTGTSRGTFQVIGSLGRTVRRPTLVERFWTPGGNPGLLAESGWGGDLTVSLTGTAATARITGFNSALTNRIVWHPSFVATGLQVWTPDNIASTRSRGVELAVAVQERDRFGFSSVASLTETRDRTDPRAASWNQQVRYIPRLTGGTELWRRFGATLATLSAKYTGSRSISSDGSQTEPAFTVVSADVVHIWSRPGIRFVSSMGIRNLFDAEYSVVRLYPMPGRHLTSRLQITF